MTILSADEDEEQLKLSCCWWKCKIHNHPVRKLGSVILCFIIRNIYIAGQDGGVGRYTSPHCTTKRRTTINLKIKNNQNCQKNNLYGSLTTKDLKKKHSSRPAGGAGQAAGSERTHGKVVAGEPGVASWKLAMGQPVDDRLGGPT